MQWATETTSTVSGDKFQLLRYGKNEEPKRNTVYTVYKTQEDYQIERKQHLKDLGVIMSTDRPFKEHSKEANVMTARKMTRWVMGTFETREIIPIVTMFKSLMLSRL